MDRRDGSQTFKKTEQTVGRPETTGLDYQDDLIKNPPNVKRPALPLLNVRADVEARGKQNVQDAPYADKDGREQSVDLRPVERRSDYTDPFMWRQQ